LGRCQRSRLMIFEDSRVISRSWNFLNAHFPGRELEPLRCLRWARRCRRLIGNKIVFEDPSLDRAAGEIRLYEKPLFIRRHIGWLDQSAAAQVAVDLAAGVGLLSDSQRTCNDAKCGHRSAPLDGLRDLLRNL